MFLVSQNERTSQNLYVDIESFVDWVLIFKFIDMCKLFYENQNYLLYKLNSFNSDIKSQCWLFKLDLYKIKNKAIFKIYVFQSVEKLYYRFTQVVYNLYII